MTAKPLVSFCVKSFNQRKFIAAALEGAFSQTYRPLEIVISDDCSTDGTGGFIKKAIDGYKAKGGDIPVVFNRNKENLGNLGNWLVFGKLTKGNLLVKADGDDISLPDRAEKIVAAWTRDGRKAKIVQHRGIVMDCEGRELHATVGDNGSCQAYTRDLWTNFPVAAGIDRRKKIYDDIEFSVRAMALAGDCATLAIPDLLVKYRLGSGDTTRRKTYRETMALDWAVVHDSIAHGLEETALNMSTLDKDAVNPARMALERRVRESHCNLRLVDAGQDWSLRRAAARELERDFGRNSPRDRLFHSIFLLPRFLADALLAPYYRFFYFRRKYPPQAKT